MVEDIYYIAFPELLSIFFLLILLSPAWHLMMLDMVDKLTGGKMSGAYYRPILVYLLRLDKLSTANNRPILFLRLDKLFYGSLHSGCATFANMWK